jgi:aspartokinase-like uncharacterized kinase
MKVIKLGGSLLNSSVKMLACLNHISRLNEKKIVVCGGGMFADTVRHAQQSFLFSDGVAHEMAILAMQQTALLCQSLNTQFSLCHDVADLSNAVLNSNSIIWSPSLNDINAAKLPATWELSSDSLAAWLADTLGAKSLMVVKSCHIDPSLPLEWLETQGIIDKNFSYFVNKAPTQYSILSIEDFLKK